MGKYGHLWRKRQLVPCWAIQIISCVALAAIAIALLATASTITAQPGRVGGSAETDDNTWYGPYGYTVDSLAAYARITGAVVLAATLGTLAVDAGEVVLFRLGRLAPALLLAAACAKAFVWGVYFCFAVIGAATMTFSVTDLVFSTLMTVTSVVPLVFAAQHVHRNRKARKAAAAELARKALGVSDLDVAVAELGVVSPESSIVYPESSVDGAGSRVDGAGPERTSV
ncbi:hypothetical protein F4780DRAFT_392030 [Xylariomycetidae sp. FL0641]|nr:hypothetical protein F4780DRAFT_392030 [Xylariomycetidae sp. FL0641]